MISKSAHAESREPQTVPHQADKRRGQRDRDENDEEGVVGLIVDT